ncbi:MAG: peptidoglycan editing factor PgeF [Alphaproteobacteria bacterium]
MLKCTELASISTIRHGFFTREGGVSSGIYASLNCGMGSGDDKALVQKNRDIAQEALGADTLCIAYQVHSADVLIVDKPFDNPPELDALVTSTPGLAIGILTADCAPVLLADHKAGVVAAAHAGWKGAFTGVLENTVAAMQTLGAEPERIIAAIGPTICQQSYEVDIAFKERFVEQDIQNDIYFLAGQRDGHFLFDLPGYCKDRLTTAGVKHINILAHDTYSDENSFFSFRRATHRGETMYGRQLSAISITR